MKCVVTKRVLVGTSLVFACSFAQTAMSIYAFQVDRTDRTSAQRGLITETKPILSPLNVPETLLKEGKVHFQYRDFPAALSDLNEALNLLRQAEDRTGETRALTVIAKCYEAMGKHQRALENFFQALKLQRRLQDGEGEAYSLGDIGNIYRVWGYPDEGLRHLRSAFAICSSLQQCAARPQILNYMGMIFFDRRDYKPALQYYQQALQLYRDAGDQPHVALILNNIGAALNASGRFSEALPWLIEANSLARCEDVTELVAISFSNVGFSYVGLHDPVEAEKSYREAMTVFRQLGMREREFDLRTRLDHLAVSVSRQR